MPYFIRIQSVQKSVEYVKASMQYTAINKNKRKTHDYINRAEKTF